MAGADVQGGEKVVGYAGKQVEDLPPVWTPWLLVILAMVGVAVVTCVWIEVLNARAGFYLPRDFERDPGKWRTGGTPHDARDDLYSVVTTLGLLQYPLLVVLAVTLVTLLPGRSARKRVVGAALLVVLGCGVMMVYRGYFTSLGI